MVEPAHNDDHSDQDSSEAERSSQPDAEEVFHDCNEATVLQSMETSLETKAEAAKLFKEGDLASAINKYRLALNQAPDDEKKHRAILNFNLGMCLVKSQGPIKEEPVPESQKKQFGQGLAKEMPKVHK